MVHLPYDFIRITLLAKIWENFPYEFGQKTKNIAEAQVLAALHCHDTGVFVVAIFSAGKFQHAAIVFV